MTNGTSGRSADDDPGRADARARADLTHPRAAALRGEQVQQPARLGVHERSKPSRSASASARATSGGVAEHCDLD